MDTRTAGGHKADMMGFDAFLDELQAALNHLNDPAFQPGPAFCQRVESTSGRLGWADPLRTAIHCLQPSPDAPPQSRGHRLYQVLLKRYVHDTTQDTVAEQLGITARHLRREQNDAVQTLARLLWERSGGTSAQVNVKLTNMEVANGEPANGELADGVTEAMSTGEWSLQLRQELTALQRGASPTTADAGETIDRVVELLAPVLEKSGIVLGAGVLPLGLTVAAQSTGLRQLLVRIVTEWSRHLVQGKIRISAESAADQALIRLTGSHAALDDLADDPLVQELLRQFGGGLQMTHSDLALHLTISLAVAPPVRVLVVDDNADLHHFYRRFVANTRYQIISLTDGELLFDALEEVRPDAILLDVMLPTVDGWELLTQLRQHPLGRSLPVLVCSVIQEEELARALGATGYVRKPVGRSALLQALHAALL